MLALRAMSHRGSYLTICYKHTYRLHQSFVSGLPSFAVPRIPSNNGDHTLAILPFSARFCFSFFLTNDTRHKALDRNEDSSLLEKSGCSSFWPPCYFFRQDAVSIGLVPQLRGLILVLNLAK